MGPGSRGGGVDVRFLLVMGFGGREELWYSDLLNNKSNPKF